MIEIIKAKEEYFDPIIPLLFETGYYECAALNNKLKLSAPEFHKLQSLKPYLEHMYVLIHHQEVAGFYIALTKKQLNDIENNTACFYDDDATLMETIERVASFYQESLDSDLIALNAAIHPRYRGHGLYQMIKNHRNELAKRQKCTRIIFGVWRTNPASVVFKSYGALYFGEIHCEFQSIQDQLLKGIFEVNEN